MYIDIEGTITTQLSEDDWVDAFLIWLESRNETFGGYTSEVKDEPRESDGIDFNRGSF